MRRTISGRLFTTRLLVNPAYPEDSHLDLPERLDYRSTGDPEIQPRFRVKHFPPELAGILPELIRGTGCENWQMLRAPLPRRESTVYFLNSPGFRLPGLVLKIYRKDAVGKNLAKSLHEASGRYHRAATAEHAVPEPVMVLPGANALVMQWIDAPVFGSLLRNGFHLQRTRDAINHRAAGWLNWFHEQSGILPEPFDARHFIARIEKTAGAVSLRQDQFLAESVQLACRLALEMHGLLMPHATSHGDFTPFNLFSQGERTIGFDYQVKHRLPVSHDVCRFLVYLGAARFRGARPLELRKHGCRTRDLELFMAAYPAGRELLDNGSWIRLQFMEVTRRLVSLTLAPSTGRNKLLRALERAGLRRDLHYIAGALS